MYVCACSHVLAAVLCFMFYCIYMYVVSICFRLRTRMILPCGTHWVRYEGENVLRVVRLSEERYSCADNAKYMSWVALARGGGRRGSGPAR